MTSSLTIQRNFSSLGQGSLGLMDLAGTRKRRGQGIPLRGGRDNSPACLGVVGEQTEAEDGCWLWPQGTPDQTPQPVSAIEFPRRYRA